MFGITSTTLQRWERRGLVPKAIRPRGWWKLYPREEIERLVEQFGALRPPYPDPDRAGCYRVPLTGFDMRRHEAIIDAESLPVLEGRQFYWNVGSQGDGYVSLARKGETIALHRLILGITDPDVQIVHANGNPLDCRKENLLVRVTHSMTDCRVVSALSPQCGFHDEIDHILWRLNWRFRRRRDRPVSRLAPVYTAMLKRCSVKTLQQDRVSVSREDLYEKVWNVSVTKLATSYGISDVGLAKACKRHQIPRPPVGYWAQKAVGRAPKRPPLPVVVDPKLQTVEFAPGPSRRKEPDESTLMQGRVPTFDDHELKATYERFRQAVPSIEVSDRVRGKHPLTRRAARLIAECYDSKGDDAQEAHWRRIADAPGAG